MSGYPLEVNRPSEMSFRIERVIASPADEIVAINYFCERETLNFSAVYSECANGGLLNFLHFGHDILNVYFVSRYSRRFDRISVDVPAQSC